MLTKEVIKAAKLCMKDRMIKDAVVGLSLIAIQLDNGHVGVSYTIRENLPNGCSIFPYAQNLIGNPVEEIADWLITGGEDVQRGIGMAVITALSQSLGLSDIEEPDLIFGVRVLPTDTVGMIGYIKPVAMEFRKRAERMKIFDMGLSARGGNELDLYPTEEQPRQLPDCDIVVLSGTTMVNNTIIDLLEMCKNAREIIMVGPSTPMFPDAFRNTNISVLAGSWWDSKYKDEIFKKISLACGISHLRKYMIKKCVKVK